MRTANRSRVGQITISAFLVIVCSAVLNSQERKFGVKPQFSRFSKQSPRFHGDTQNQLDSTNPPRRLTGSTIHAPTNSVQRPIGNTELMKRQSYHSTNEHRNEGPRHTTRTREVSNSTDSGQIAPLPPPSTQTSRSTQRQVAWWDNAIRKHALQSHDSVRVSLESLITSALQHSAQIHVYQELPLIRETSIMEADAVFDWTSFVETRWNDINEPVGNLLTTNEDRYSDRNLNTSFGVRRKNTIGGQFEISQRLGQQNTNSQFFIPHNQATSRLTLGYTQPLLRGAGRVYNTSLTVLAQIDKNGSESEFSKQLQGHLLEVARAYWGLYLERGNLLQRRRLYGRAKDIHEKLTQRADIDALKPQIVRARSAVESRRSDILRAERDIRISESRIRALVNDPALGTFGSSELLPLDRPFSEFIPVDIPSSVEQAFQHRPEINQAMLQIKSAGVRYNMSKNELLPSLNLILETYASGLRGNSNLHNAITDQYTEGEPSYSVGFQYEFPLWNRASQARYQRRRLELRQMESQFRATLQNLNLEVETAVRELTTSYREIDAKYRSMEAAQAEVDYLQDRWELLPGDDRSASLLLEDLLDAQERLTTAEFEYLDAQMAYSLSQMSYRRAIGTLLIAEDISVTRYCECFLPQMQLERQSSRKVERPAPTKQTDAPRQTKRLPANPSQDGRW